MLLPFLLSLQLSAVYTADSLPLPQLLPLTTDLPVGRGAEAERLLGFRLVVHQQPVMLTGLDFSLGHQVDTADVRALGLVYTGGQPRLSQSAVLAQTAVAREGRLQFEQVLNPGEHYFWLTARLSPEAREGNQLQAAIHSLQLHDGRELLSSPLVGRVRSIILSHQLLFSGGDDGSVNYRIPAVVSAADGSVVVAVDARVDAAGDLPNNIDIRMRRSTDLGNSWSATTTIADFGSSGASDPALVRDKRTGDLLCMFASHRGLFESTAADPIRFQVCRSRDHGLSWSPPQDMTAQIYAPGWEAAWLASGSAHQLRSGRLLGVVGVREQGRGRSISNAVIYSDDGGHHWHYLPAIATQTGDEAKIVELDDGSLLMNIRNQTPDCRQIVRSTDGGLSWSAPRYDSVLVDPAVNGDLLRYSSVVEGADTSRLLFAIAADPQLRRNLTIFMSYDEGNSWPVKKVLNAGDAAYAALTLLQDGSIACVYENGEYEHYQIYFARFSLQWLLSN